MSDADLHDEDALLDAITAGASGLRPEAHWAPTWVPAVHTVATAQSMLAPATTARLMRSLRADPAETPALPPAVASPSPGERNILALVGDGLTNREIGKRRLSEKTVRNHISRLPAEMSVQRRLQAAVLASPPRAAGDRGPLHALIAIREPVVRRR